MITLFCVITLLVLVAALLCIKCKLYIECSVNSGITVKIGLLGMWFKVGKKANDEKVKIPKQSALKDVEKSYADILKKVAEVKKKITVEKANLYIEMGLYDAAATGIATGAAWIIIYSLKALLQRLFILKEYNANVVPCFLEEKIDARFSAIFSIKVAHMLIILKNIKFKTKRR